MALRAGVVAADLEFYQFHPTSLDAPGNFLVSEAVRGEGATLIDADGKRFMFDVHPDGELAPRDVVARGIAMQMAKQPGVPVRLDATALGAEFLAKRFPNIDAACRAQGFDWGEVPIPVTPAAHYYMGGIRTDEWGRTSLPGLYAVGEAACNGLHGANRLASNSLLEGAVYGTRVIEGLNDPQPVVAFDDEWPAPIAVDLLDDPEADDVNRTDLQRLMWDAAGLARNGDDLEAAIAELKRFKAPTVNDAKSAEDANLLVVARAVVTSALARQESRGGHYRTDFPETDPAQARHSSVVSPMLERRQIQRVVDMALDEDAPFGDLTSQTLVPVTAKATADLVAREPGVFAGAEVFEIAMTTLDPSVTVTLHAADGDRFDKGAVLATVERSGPSRAAVRAGRTQPRPTHDRHRDAHRDVRRGRRRHQRSRGRHPQDDAGSACAGAARRTVRRRAQPPLLAVGRRDGQGQPPRRHRRHHRGAQAGQGRSAAHHAHRGRGRPARADRCRARLRSRAHDHARQLLARRPASRRRADR